MSERNGDAGMDGASSLVLADSLAVLREMIESADCDSVASVVSAAVQALIQHQDFDGCLVVIGGDSDRLAAPAASQHGAARMPGFLDAVVASEVIPTLMGEGVAFVDSKLGDRSPNWCGSLLGIPIREKQRVMGGLIVWSQHADALMPWHQTLLEMLASIVTLVLGQLDTGDDAQEPGLDEHIPSMLAPDTGSTVRGPDEELGSIDRLVDLDDLRSFERSLEDLATAPLSSLRARYILFVDIDRFRLVREYGGEMTAERMIRVFADLLRREMAGEELIGRLGTNQFGVVIERRSREQAIVLAESLVSTVDSLRLSFFGQRYDVSISVGVAELQTTSSESGLASLRRARQACEAAQKQGGGSVLSYHDSLAVRRRSHSESRLLNHLTRALKDDDLVLYAQPIAPLGDAELAAASSPIMHELLLRMHDDDDGLIDAGALLTVAERYGLSAKLDRWVIENAFRLIAASRLAHDADHRFALNLSGHSIDDQRLLGFIVEQFEQSGLSPQRICFEITETAAISDIGAAQTFVQQLKKLGCEFALDDFGSGHSSFLYLRDLPTDYLKIDGELVREIANDPVSLAFVRTIESVARLMGRRTIAEFVETEAIRDAIAEIGCNYVQGYLVGHPVPLDNVLKDPAS